MINECCTLSMFFSLITHKPKFKLNYYWMLFISGEESCLDRVCLVQLTQLFLTSVLECPFYKVTAGAVLLHFPWSSWLLYPTEIFKVTFLLVCLSNLSTKQNFCSFGVSSQQATFSLIIWPHSFFWSLQDLFPAVYIFTLCSRHASWPARFTLRLPSVGS